MLAIITKSKYIESEEVGKKHSGWLLDQPSILLIQPVDFVQNLWFKDLPVNIEHQLFILFITGWYLI